MKILFIAPIPPPIDGQSKASNMVLEKLLSKDDVTVVNLSKNTLKNGQISMSRVSEIFTSLILVNKNRKNKDVIYLSIAESFLGNIRDLCIYIICFNNLKNLYIHMLGGAGMAKIISGSGLMSVINRFFLKKIGGAIVEGSLNFDIFSKVMPAEKISIVPNFAEDYLFLDDGEVHEKFSNVEEIQILYLSNLIPGKGYKELVEAYSDLQELYKKKIVLTFVGGFESVKDQNEFLTSIENEPRIKYLGKFIDGKEKRKLYRKTHVFCLPTYYPFEGQPISILEAYATGCVVISSDHSGIPFIFKNNINGYMVDKKSVFSLRSALEKVVIEKSNLKQIALYNSILAKSQYRSTIFQESIYKIFLKSK